MTEAIFGVWAFVLVGSGRLTVIVAVTPSETIKYVSIVFITSQSSIFDQNKIDRRR